MKIWVKTASYRRRILVLNYTVRGEILVKVLGLNSSENHLEIMGRWHHWMEAKAIYGQAYFELKRLSKRRDEEMNEALRSKIGLRYAKWNLWIIEYLLKDKN